MNEWLYQSITTNFPNTTPHVCKYYIEDQNFGASCLVIIDEGKRSLVALLALANKLYS